MLLRVVSPHAVNGKDHGRGVPWIGAIEYVAHRLVHGLIHVKKGMPWNRRVAAGRGP